MKYFASVKDYISSLSYYLFIFISMFFLFSKIKIFPPQNLSSFKKTHLISTRDIAEFITTTTIAKEGNIYYFEKYYVIIYIIINNKLKIN